MLGNITKRFAACIALGLVAASVTIPANASTHLGVTVTPKVESMNFVFSTPVPTKVTLSMGTDKSYGLSVPDSLKKKHGITVHALRAGTQYYCSIRATPTKGKAFTWSAPCPTAPVAPAAFSIKNGNVLAGGEPTFLTVLYLRSCPDESTPGNLSSLGAQVVSSGACLAPAPADNSAEVQQLNNVLTNNAWWLEPNPANLSQLSSLAMLLGSRDNFNFPTDPGSLLGCKSSSGAGLASAISKAGTTKPAIADLYIASQLSPSIPNCLNDSGLRALVWESVARHVKGIELVPQLPWNDVYDTNLEQKVKSLVLQIAALQPALLSTPATVSASGSLVVGATRYFGTTYVVAVNPTVEPVDSSITAGSATSKLASVWHEGRQVKVRSRSFSDHFAPLAVHIYMLK